MTTIAALVFGFSLGVLFALLVEKWQKRKAKI